MNMALFETDCFWIWNERWVAGFAANLEVETLANEQWKFFLVKMIHWTFRNNNPCKWLEKCNNLLHSCPMIAYFMHFWLKKGIWATLFEWRQKCWCLKTRSQRNSPGSPFECGGVALPWEHSEKFQGRIVWVGRRGWDIHRFQSEWDRRKNIRDDEKRWLHEGMA